MMYLCHSSQRYYPMYPLWAQGFQVHSLPCVGWGARRPPSRPSFIWHPPPSVWCHGWDARDLWYDPHEGCGSGSTAGETILCSTQPGEMWNPPSTIHLQDRSPHYPPLLWGGWMGRRSRCCSSSLQVSYFIFVCDYVFDVFAIIEVLRHLQLVEWLCRWLLKWIIMLK